MSNSEKWAIVDWDHTLTDQEDPTKCWISYIFDKFSKTKNAQIPKTIKYASKILNPIVKYKVQKNPNRDPKNWEILLIGKLSKGTPLQEIYVSPTEISYDNQLLNQLKELKKNNYKIAIVTASPKTVVNNWIKNFPSGEERRIFDEIYGLEINVDSINNIIQGLDTKDKYTQIAVEEGIASAKNFAIADIISKGGIVEISYGNSPGDIPDFYKIKKYLKQISNNPVSYQNLTHYNRPHGKQSFEESVINPV